MNKIPVNFKQAAFYLEYMHDSAEHILELYKLFKEEYDKKTNEADKNILIAQMMPFLNLGNTILAFFIIKKNALTDEEKDLLKWVDFSIAQLIVKDEPDAIKDSQIQKMLFSFIEKKDII